MNSTDKRTILLLVLIGMVPVFWLALLIAPALEDGNMIEALPQIIDNRREQGFEFITVSELMSSDYRIPEEVARQYAPMPEGYEWPTEVAE